MRDGLVLYAKVHYSCYILYAYYPDRCICVVNRKVIHFDYIYIILLL